MSSECGCKEVYISSYYLYIPTPLVSALFKMFFVLVPIHFCNNKILYLIIFSHSINEKH